MAAGGHSAILGRFIEEFEQIDAEWCRRCSAPLIMGFPSFVAD